MKVTNKTTQVARITLPCEKRIEHLSYEVLEMFENYYGGIPIDEWICNFCRYSNKVVLDYGLTITVCTAHRKI
ncbi:hypothetical protein PAP_05050 [Palaeococcus pacificus DY20341]|uniref:Uncharacterized protein n=2 Tax=Palaeococcus TaxID=83867 RepID=A0A075LTG6_9EURY|nr:hypothetical protein PAP_05050 [Palaeococcus pacificus DY20341]